MQYSTLPIRFDKSHLTTIGTRLYAESLDFVRELVANAYDADATKVKITLTENELIVDDDGSGMNKEGLAQYFTIGSDFKKENPITPVFKRRRIGEFGIGKFAVLSLCDRFTIFTGRNDYCATVVFDRHQFEEDRSWRVPIIEHGTKPASPGTKVTLHDLRYPISYELLERKLRQQLPLGQKDFGVYINGIRLTPHIIPGKKYRIREQTEFGEISGEIILSSLLLPQETQGVAIKVRGITIKRELFDLDKLHYFSTRRVTGEINADFLPLTSGRDNFLKDSKEYKKFIEVVEKKLKKVVRDIKKSSLSRLDLKTDQALSNAMQLVKNALKKNTDIFLMHDLPLFSGPTTAAGSLDQTLGTTTIAQKLGKNRTKKDLPEKVKIAINNIKNKKHKSIVKTVLRDKNRIVKRLKIGGLNLVCSLSHMGEREAESFVEGGIIFINRDHPLFTESAKDDEVSAYHLARLITQEIVKLANPEQIYQAYEWQSRLLTDALVSEGRKKADEDKE